jgi:hybrid polyketide synthase/nonribosomal peptide synthetase ACE1
MKLIDVIGGSLFSRLQDETGRLEAVMPADLTDDLCSEVLGVATGLREVAKIAKQLNHRFPHMNILEIGQTSQVIPRN